MGLVSELRRRNVFRMAALYAAAAWLVMQVVDVVEGKLPLPDWMGSAVLAVLAVGFPIALVISWFYEVTPEGISRDTDEESAESTTGFTGRRVDFVIISVLCRGSSRICLRQVVDGTTTRAVGRGVAIR